MKETLIDIVKYTTATIILAGTMYGASQNNSLKESTRPINRDQDKKQETKLLSNYAILREDNLLAQMKSFYDGSSKYRK